MDNVWARFFPIFLENDLLKVDGILGLPFFRKEKASKDSKRRFPFTLTEFCGRWIVYNSRLFAFSNRKHLAQKSKFSYDKQIRKQTFAEILRFK